MCVSFLNKVFRGNMENKKVKRRLDEQAKVFTLVSNPKYCSVFRFDKIM